MTSTDQTTAQPQDTEGAMCAPELPAIPDYTAMTSGELTAHLDKARRDHNKLLNDLAKQYDDLAAVMQTLKTGGEYTAEITLRTNGGKQKFTFAAEEPFNTRAAPGVLQGLVRQALTKTGVNTKRWQQTKGERDAVERSIRQEQEKFHRLEGQIANAMDDARGREQEAAARRASGAKTAHQNAPAPLSMRERLARRTA